MNDGSTTKNGSTFSSLRISSALAMLEIALWPCSLFNEPFRSSLSPRLTCRTKDHNVNHQSASSLQTASLP